VFFINSIEQTKILTASGERDDPCLLMMYLAELRLLVLCH